MAKIRIVVVLCQLMTLPILGGLGNDSPLEDMLSSFMQSYGESSGSNLPGMLGSVVGSLMQGDNAKNLGALFGQENNGNAGDLLSGLGSLLGGQNGQLDPTLIGSMVSMFAQSMTQQPNERQKRESSANDFNLESVMGLFANSGSLLPMILNGLSSATEKISHDHKDHASFLPPYLEKLHLYWDLFINSELGKTVWEKTGMRKAFKAFESPDGKISFDLMFKNFENHSFRRHWIKAVAKYLTDMVIHVAKPEVYQRYLVSGEYIVNSFLATQGVPSSTHFDMKRPEKSITVIVNYGLKRYLDMDTDVSGYVRPAIDYVKQLLKMAQSASLNLASRGDYNALADRVTDTLNLEVIEPVLRVYRAYKHSIAAPQCQEHLMCLVNRHHDQDKRGLPGFKAGLTKFSSMVASAALSYQNGKGFWDLYNAIQNDVNCDSAYPADCSSFHEHELKVTTEVYHNEL